MPSIDPARPRALQRPLFASAPGTTGSTPLISQVSARGCTRGGTSRWPCLEGRRVPALLVYVSRSPPCELCPIPAAAICAASSGRGCPSGSFPCQSAHRARRVPSRRSVPGPAAGRCRQRLLLTLPSTRADAQDQQRDRASRRRFAITTSIAGLRLRSCPGYTSARRPPGVSLRTERACPEAAVPGTVQSLCVTHHGLDVPLPCCLPLPALARPLVAVPHRLVGEYHPGGLGRVNGRALLRRERGHPALVRLALRPGHVPEPGDQPAERHLDAADERHGWPAGQQLAGQPPGRVAYLRARIASGELPPDSKIPRHILLAYEYGVSPETTAKAVSFLRDEGLVIVGAATAASSPGSLAGQGWSQDCYDSQIVERAPPGHLLFCKPSNLRNPAVLSRRYQYRLQKGVPAGQRPGRYIDSKLANGRRRAIRFFFFFFRSVPALRLPFASLLSIYLPGR